MKDVPMRLRQLPEWQDRGACRGADADKFFPEKGVSSKPAVAICDTCEVADECFEYGMRMPHGIWGGTTQRTRRQIRRGDVVLAGRPKSDP